MLRKQCTLGERPDYGIQRWKGTRNRGHAQELKVPEEGLSVRHKRQKGSVCARGLMREAVRDMLCENIVNWSLRTLNTAV